MKIYAYALATIVILYLGNLGGEWFGWYRKAIFYDVPMHVLGGLGLGFFFMALLRTRRPSVVLAAVFGAGLLWEIFEAVIGSAGAPFASKLYVLDTVKDFAANVFGAYAAWFICSGEPVKDGPVK